MKKIYPSESQVQLAILHYLKSIGAYAGKVRVMGVRRGKSYCLDPYTFRGFPDLCFFHKKRLYFCEVKKKPNKQTEMQIVFQTHCKIAGIDYILAYDVQDVINRIEKNECYIN